MSTTFDLMMGARRWLIWQEVRKPGKSKPEKVPFYTDGKRRGATDTPEDTARLATYGEASNAAAARGQGWAVGFALGPDSTGHFWQGIDLDKIAENRLPDLAEALPGYVEESPSGKGVHAIGYGRHFRSFGSNGTGMEAYSAGRFFTFTGKVIRDGAIICLADYVENSLAQRHKAQSLNVSPAAKATAVMQVSAQTVADLRSALNCIRSDEYALWIEMGHALKTLGDAGRGLWFDWSVTSPKYDPQEAARKWDSFDPQHIGYQAVFAKAQECGWINPASNAAIFKRFADDISPAGEAGTATIAATPFSMPAYFEIPPRPWVFGHWLLRGTVTTVIAPGGTGKSALMVTAAMSLASGRELLGKTVWGDPKRVWLWNLEDDHDELTRQIAACSLHHGISERQWSDRLYVNDAASSLCVASKGRDGLTIHEPIVDAVAKEIRKKAIDVLIVDPFVSSHRAEENDNGQVDAIAKLWARIARETNCCIVLVHHSRKLAGQKVDAEAARGASALGNAARSVLVLNRMEIGEATRFGIIEEDRRRYIRVSNDKANRVPAGKADWYRLASVPLANGGPAGGDNVSVVEQWTPLEVTAIYDDDIRAKIQVEIASGEWRAHISATNWAGKAVAKVLGVDLADPAVKSRVKSLLDDMLNKGQLRVEERRDASRKLHKFVVIDEQVENSCASPMW